MAGRVLRIDDDGRVAIVDIDDRSMSVSLALLVLEGTPVAVDDWLLVHTGFAMEVMSSADAAELRALHAAMSSRGPDLRPVTDTMSMEDDP